MSELKKTPLHDGHVALGARMGEFANFLMPIYYRGILEEHQGVRHGVGLFDISHMGRIRVRGEAAFDFLQCLITNDLKKLRDGKILYTPLCSDTGGILDDILVYQVSANEFFLVVNASNLTKDFAWLKTSGDGYGVSITDESAQTALLALQGPASALLMERLLGSEPHRILYYHFQVLDWKGASLLVSRTGYTGEDGFEICLPAQRAAEFWDEALRLGRDLGVMPVGLGARDTLRLEMRYLLYGNDMDEKTTPLEAGLGWTVAFHKGDFLGRSALEAQRQEGLARRLVGFGMIDSAIPRHGCALRRDGREIGKVTSGSYSPTLNKNIGLAMVEIVYAHVGIPVYVSIRGGERLAEVVRTPFYRGVIHAKSGVQNQKSRLKELNSLV